MSKVLVLGATGYLGQTLCLNLLRSGNHTVYGLARSEAKARSLAAQEIIPVIGSVTDSKAYIDLIRHKHIDVVVDCSGAAQGSAQVLQDVVSAGKERLEKYGPERKGSKLGFVYTSGSWVHGSSYDPVNDLEPLGEVIAAVDPPRLVAWRVQMEKDILAATEFLDVVIGRPALLYGREHGIWSIFFGPIVAAAKSGADHVRLPIHELSLPGLCHVDDAASGLQVAVEKVALISGTGVYPVFDLVTSVESIQIIFSAAASVLGFKGKIELVGAGEDDIFPEAMQTSFNGSSGRAKQILGWEPKRIGFAANMQVYAPAFVAAQEQQEAVAGNSA